MLLHFERISRLNILKKNRENREKCGKIFWLLFDEYLIEFIVEKMLRHLN